MSDLLERFANLSPEKRQLILKKLQQQGKGATPTAVTSITPATRDDKLPLSFSQQRFWFLEKFEGSSIGITVPQAFRLTGQLNAPALEQSLNEIIRRHETLRFRLAESEGQPYITILPELHLALLPPIDLTHIPTADREAAARALLVSAMKRPLDFYTDPLIRAFLYRLSDTEHILFIIMHHIISDGWSLSIVGRELNLLYTAFSQGQPSPLPELPIQYIDFVYWQNERLQGEALQKYLDYWEPFWSSPATPLSLPTKPTASQEFEHAIERLNIPLNITQDLRQLGKEENASLYMVLLATLNVLLYRYTLEEDISVGTYIANRNQSEIEGLIGFFLNILVFRCTVDGRSSFRDFLQHVRDITLGAYTHQDIPFEKLLNEFQPDSRFNATAPFQVLLMLQNTPTPPIQPPGLRIDWVDLSGNNPFATYDFTVVLTESINGLEGFIEYNANKFAPETIQKMAGQWLTLLTAVPQQKETPLAKLPLTTAAPPPISLPQTTPAPTAEQFMHGLFETQAARTPNALALSSAVGSLTYAELNGRANQLAHALRQWGVGPETLVAVCQERTPNLLISLLAILKAGGAYVPLDPAYPAERVAFMLSDSQAPVLLTQTALLGGLPPHTARAFCLDGDWSQVAGNPATNLPIHSLPENLAYIIYTSGSTGRPKGVAISHRNAVDMLKWGQGIYSPEELTAVAAVTSICFDLSVYELFLPLSVGGQIILADNALHLLTHPHRDQISLINTVPSAMAELVRSGGVPASVRTVNLAGEPLKRVLVQQIYHQTAVTKVYNLYGPSEDTTYSTWVCIDRDDPAEPSIGRPLSHTQAHILDEQFQATATGELYLAGEGVSRGYLRRPSLTAERYLPNPFASTPGERMYKTGDLSRRRPDGQLDYLGRADHQVKIRGFRIELGEIEAALSRHPALTNLVVVAGDDPATAAKRLIAYVSAAPHLAPTPAELRTFLAPHLPDYMLPSLFIILEHIPLTPNGKIDRKALPAPETIPSHSRTLIPPRTATEQTLADIWRELLGLPEVSMDDNFFDLGGHSLIATQLASRIRQLFHVELGLRQLFEANDLASLAHTLETAQQNQRTAHLPALLPVARTEALPLSFAQQRLWFLDQLEPDSPFYNLPTTLRINGKADVAVIQQCLKEIAHRHESLRTCFPVVNGQPQQTILPTLTPSLNQHDLRLVPATEKETQLRQLLFAEAEKPFDLATGPLFRATLFWLEEESYLLLLNMHHIVSDGWSLGLLSNEFITLYAAFSQNQPSPLPDLPVQYPDFAVWQRSWLSGDLLERELAYWKAHLQNAPTVLPLPTDRPRPAHLTYRGASYPVHMELPLTEALQNLSRQNGATLFMTLLAAFQTLLSRYSGATAVTVGTPIANRDHLLLENLIGFFVNTLALHTDLSGNPTFVELLQRVRQVALGAYDHQHLPFEKLVEELQPVRDMSHTPIFQVMFALQNVVTASLPTLPNITFQPLDVESRASQFDLTLTLTETATGLSGEWSYSTDLFNRETIATMQAHLELLLRGIVANPGQPIANYPLLLPTEQAQWATWNDTTRPLPSASIHTLFEQQAQRTPHAMALCTASATLTYAELNGRSNQLAHALQKWGVGPETLVAVCQERTADLLISLLAILKAGGAYVPLDPAYPADRVAFMMRDSQSKVLLTQEALLDRLPPHSARVFCVDRDWAQVAHEPIANINHTHTPEHLAYIIYTSGSTGRPKGVAINHRNAVAMLAWGQETYGREELTAVAAVTSVCFDLSIYELFLPLSVGGQIILADNALHLLNHPHRDQITLINTVPSAMAELIRSAGVPASVRTINLAGEPLKRVLVQQIYNQTAVEKVYNLYGPSEDTTYSTWSLIDRDDPAEPSIGRPLSNTQAFILDNAFNPVPLVMVGELYLAGEGVSRGYLGRPSLTAERYLPNPFSTQPGGRMYKTGDLARYCSDRSGQLEYLGRADHQVKIRGFRIELGEIEAALSQHDNINNLVIVAVDDTASASKRLIAYIEPRRQPWPTANELRAFLAPHLPDYMLPALFVFLEQMPLTPNGKIDRKALPVPQLSTQRPFQSPHTPTEETLATIWSDILQVGAISRDDNFFELGGHSLIATQIMAAIRQTFDTALPLRLLFDAPTIAELAACIDQNRQTAPTVSAIQPLSTPGPRPLSFAQQRLWFLEWLEPGATYNVSTLVELQGKLSLPALRQSFNELVQRHEGLRTLFPEQDGRSIQHILPRLIVPLTSHDLRSLPSSEREAQAQTLLLESSQTPFDLATGPLVRLLLLQMADETYHLLITLHHIITDAWSMQILLREWALLYQAQVSGVPASLPPLPIQYSDFAVWHRHWLEGDLIAQQTAYWQEALAGDLPILELPTDRPRPSQMSYAGATVPLVLPAELAQAIIALSRQEGVTLFMTLLTAYKLFLYRLTGVPDVIVGSPIANRQQPEVENLVGIFINTLALRSNLSGNPSFHEALARVRGNLLAAYAHQDLPFEQLIDALHLERDMSRPPLFQTLFVLQKETAPYTAGEVRWHSADFANKTAKFDLTLFVLETAVGGLTAAIEYSTDLFDEATIHRFWEHFIHLLTGLIANPQQPIDALPLLTPAEQAQLAAWNDTAQPLPAISLHQLFEQQVARTPQAIALRTASASLTYAELNGRANQLAHALQKWGSGPECFVAVCQERTAEMVISLLAILKTGGAYVPLDPTYPADRVAFMLQDSQAKVLLTQESLLNTLPPQASRVFCMDRDWSQLANEPTTDLIHSQTPENLAYLIYTSGSTGRPKGVAITHRSAVAMLAWAQKTYSREELTATAAVTSICFDLSVYELFLPLSVGGQIILADNALHLLDHPHREAITLMNTVPSAMAELVRANGVPPSVQTINLAGEPLKHVLVQQIYAQTKAAKVYNLYGPSEDTTYSTWSLIERDDLSEPTIGRPLSNTQAHVLDLAFNPVPIGVVGELYLAGAGVSRGYLGRPALTAERYLPNPFAVTPGDRMYKTGDLVRWQADGQMVYLGRSDHQVKIRGYRIELGEIEAALSRHPNIANLVVVAQEQEASKRLVAYFEPRRQPAPTPAELRAFLAPHLPDYMLPAWFIPLNPMPLTPNGKIDRKALPIPKELQRATTQAFLAPRNPLEEQLVGIWQEILGVSPIGVQDHFFELGGHSLLATQLISRIRQTFAIELLLRVVFASPTIETLAHEIKTARRAAQGLVDLPLLPQPRDQALSLSFAQQRLWFLDQLEPGQTTYNLPLAIRVHGPLNVATLEQALAEILHRHESLRTVFTTDDKGEPVQLILPAPPASFVRHDFTGLAPETAVTTALQAATETAVTTTFNLTTGPLLHAHLFGIAADDHILLFVMHHIISDGWSLTVLFRELATLYAAYSTQQPSPLPPLPVQYPDFALWQRAWLSGDVLERQLAYWRTQLSGDLPVLALPTDYPRPAIQTYHGANFAFELSPELSQALKQFSQNEEATLFMTLLAACKTWLARLTGQTDLIIGSPIANRNRAEMEGLIGFFVNTLPLRTQLADDPTFRQLLERVRETTLEAYAYQDLPFEKLVEEVKPKRDLSRSPLFQVMFIFQNDPGTPQMDATEVTLQPFELDGRSAKFDLTLFMQEGANGLSGVLEYNTDLFAASTIARFVAYFTTLLAGIVADPVRRLSQFNLLSPAEQTKLLVDFNQTAVPFPQSANIHTLFEQQVARTPHAIALRHGSASLTYQELNQRANQLAHALQKWGIGQHVALPESLVGVCQERTPEMVISLLAILKAGGAYVPLDPAYPADRVAFMLADSQATVLLTQASLLNGLPPHAARVFCVDQDWPQVADESTANLVTTSTSDHLAYIIYTSGSTGRPKGVAISHRNAVAMLSWGQQTYTPAELTAVAAVTSICFDLSVYELFLPLSVGGQIILADNALHLLDHPHREAITLINTVPSAMAELVRANGVPPAVQTINLAGEPLKHVLVQQIYAQTTAQKVYNLYGPSEDTTYSTWAMIDRADPAEPTIGRPLSNTQAYILDAHFNPVPLSMVGELYLAGEGVSRGYLGQPSLTAERYLPNPFATTPGQRMYKTGDLVRYRSDSDRQIEYLGRADHQVKIRGFRIELGEIEAALSRHPNVNNLVVVAHDEGNSKRLVAYIEPRQQPAPTPAELRAFLAPHLPDYMLPSLFVILERMPLTPNGKIDRKALPAPDASLNQTRDTILPSTPTEQALVLLWSELLGLKKVSILDNFFDLGGHSLLVTQLASRVYKQFNIQLPHRQFFEAANLATLATAIETARRTKQTAVVPLADIPPLQPADRSQPLPLSFAQQRLWFLDQLEPNSAFYNIPAALYINGALSTAVFQQCLNELTRRHESLRTLFTVQDGEPVQTVLPPSHTPFTLHDLRHLPEPERESQAKQMALAEAETPFNLATGPLFRVTLFHLADDSYLLLLNMHHIISDGWSLGLLINELIILYTAFAQGQPSPLPELPVQYPDFAVWQRAWLTGDFLAQEMAYWKKHLQNAPTVLQLPTDRPRPSRLTYRGASYPFQLSPELSTALQTLSRQQGATLFMTLLASFQTLLYRYSGETAVTVGTPIANRDNLLLENLIGFFVNTLALHTDLSGNPRFSQLLQRVRDVTLGAYDHQHLPFEKLVEEIQPERNASYTPIFQVMFTLQNANALTLSPLPGLTLRPVEVESQTAKFDLDLGLQETPNGLVGEWSYSTDLFNRETIAAMHAHWETLLQSIVTDPEQTLADLALLDSSQRRRLLVEMNETQAVASTAVGSTAVIPTTAAIHHLFAAQAQRTPHAIAVSQEGQSLTYAQLDQRANQIAHRLRQIGLQADQFVGLALPRSLDLIAALLGVLKAGGAYLPLDPAYPADRLAFMMADAQIVALLTQTAVPVAVGETAVPIIYLDTDPQLSQQPTTAPDVFVDPDHLAYLIYTSGSTGQPKGVMISHRALTQYVSGASDYFALTPQDRVLQFASISFDTAAEEIFPCLLSGATLVLRTEAMLDTAAIFFRACAAEKITLLDLPTAYWHVLVNEMEAGPITLPDSLRLIILGGERALPERLAAWQKLAPPAIRLVNTYGPTESTIVITRCDLTGPQAPESAGVAPIGRPVPQAQAYVLDLFDQPVAPGIPGELQVGGPSLSRGYWRRPGLTAVTFTPNPFSPIPGQRLYKTGDLVRYLPDDHLEFVGRKDHQVKIRGFRIELGEIETVLRRHPGVTEAVVIARPDGAGEQKLVAYIVGDESETTADKLHTFLEQQLPAYMLPAAFVFLKSLPLTPSGKLNRRALPAPDLSARAQRERTITAPRTPTEEGLAVIWRDLLKVNEISRDDNFFKLGGHSLLATQIMARVRQTFATELPLRTLFDAPTIAGLAAHLDEARRAQAGNVLPPITPAPRNEPLPLSFAQQRLWFLDRLEPGATYNVPIATYLSGTLNVAALHESFNDIVARHEVLRTIFAQHDGRPVQIIQPQLTLPLNVLDLRALPAAQRDSDAQAYLRAEAQRPFDLATGPLLRLNLLWLEEQEYLLIVTMHHIITDAWSMELFIRELGAFYIAKTTAQPLVLPPLPIQYADFAAWQRHWLQGETLAQQIAYWRETLAGDLPVLELPADHPRPAVMTFAGNMLSFDLPDELGRALIALSRQEGVTLFMFLLTAFKVWLSRLTGETDILVGSPIANRQQRAVENLIGFFLNTLVLRSDLSGNPSFHEALGRVRDRLLSAYAHQDLPFEQLVDALHTERDLSHTPLFQVMFVLQKEAQAGNAGPLRLRPADLPNQTAKFDLTLFMVETAVGGLSGSIEYSTDLFDEATITRFWGQFTTLLAGIVANPAQAIGDLPLLTPAEQEQLRAWNATAQAMPFSGPVHELFEAQASRTPEAEAVWHDGQSLTYAELDRRANQLAHHLRGLGVTADVPVGLCVSRSFDMVVGVLGILKAGGAYLPLDPAYPTDRLAYMLDNAQAKVVLTQSDLWEALPLAGETAVASLRIIPLDKAWPTIAQQPSDKPAVALTGDNLLYVIYTSGSTGLPKGVAMRHAPLTNLVQWQTAHTVIAGPARTLQFSPISFDVSCQELFFTWHTGGTLILIEEGLRRDARALLTFLRQTAVARLFVPFIALQTLAEVATVAKELPTELREIVTAGEQLQVTAQLIAFFEALGNCARHNCVLHNHYGPTESHVATAYTLSGPPAQWPPLPPIGKPVANATIDLLSATLQPVPLGAAGELVIGGEILAREYINRPELTAERFIVLPDGRRVYRTGDLARYRADGEIEYLGRNDFQVKIRGFRIEPGEIEALLSQFAAVRQAVVAVREGQGGKRLIAYVVPQTETNESEARAFLAARLPEYMIPERFIFLERLPLTPSGKIDRRALPTPEKVQLAEAGRAFVPPRDALELQLVQIWQEVLGVYPLGIRDNFFALGGHSLLSIRLTTRMAQVLGQDVPLTLLFQNGTIEEVAAFLRRGDHVPTISPLVAIRPDGEKEPLFLVHPGGGHVLPYVALGRLWQGERPLYGLQSVGLMGEAEPLTRLEAMAATYIAALREVQPHGPYYLGGWSMGGLVAYEMAHQLEQAGETVAAVILLDTASPDTEPTLEEVGEVASLRTFALDLGLSEGVLAAAWPEAQKLDGDGRFALLIHAAQEANQLPPDMSLAQVQTLYRVFRANYHAMLAYRPNPVNATIWLYRAAERLTSEGEVAADLGWLTWLTRDQLRLEEIPGNHFMILRGENLAVLAQKLVTAV